MRTVIQRVIRAEVWANGVLISAIGRGLVAFIAIAGRDSPREADCLAAKLVGLRVFPDALGKMNLSASQVGGSLMLVPNFTLYGNTVKGSRPSYEGSANSRDAGPLYEYCVAKVRESGLTVASGVFQANMRVVVENDGPVTLIYDSPA